MLSWDICLNNRFWGWLLFPTTTVFTPVFELNNSCLLVLSFTISHHLMTVWSSFELQKWLLRDSGIIILRVRPSFMSRMQSVLLQCDWPHVQVHLLQPHEPGPADHGAHGPAEEGWHQHSSGNHASPQRHQCWLNKVRVLLLSSFSVWCPTSNILKTDTFRACWVSLVFPYYTEFWHGLHGL